MQRRRPRVLTLSTHPSTNGGRRRSSYLCRVVSNMSMFRRRQTVTRFVFRRVVLVRLSEFTRRVFSSQLYTKTYNVHPIRRFAFRSENALLEPPFLFNFFLDRFLYLPCTIILNFRNCLLNESGLRTSFSEII